MDIITLVSLALKYGPTAISAIQTYGPLVFKAVQVLAPIAKEAVAHMPDAPHLDQVNHVLGALGYEGDPATEDQLPDIAKGAS